MEKSLHLFDLDYTLWKIGDRLSVIDKRDPKNIIYRIVSDEIEFMKDYYRIYDLEVVYNGHVWYMTEDMFDVIKSLKSDIELENIGICYRDFNIDEVYDKQLCNIEYLLFNLNHLKNSRDIEIGYLSARINSEFLEKNKNYLYY